MTFGVAGVKAVFIQVKVDMESPVIFLMLCGVLVPWPCCTERLFVHSPSSAGCIARDTAFEGGGQLEAGGIQL